MKNSLKKVSKLVVLTTGFAFFGSACVADGEPYSLDSLTGSGHESPDLLDSNVNPPLISVSPQGVPKPQVLAPSQTQLSHLAVYGDSIYWVSFQHGHPILKRMHIEGGDHFEENALKSLPLAMAADDEGLYFAVQSEQEIAFASRGNLEAESSHLSTSVPLTVELSDDAVFWTASDGCLYRGEKNSKAVSQLACVNGTPTSLTLFDGNAYWSTLEGSLYESPLNEKAAAKKLAIDEEFSSGIVADNAGVYWVNQDTQSVMHYRHRDQSLQILASGQQFPAGIALDKTYLYFSTQGDGALKRIQKTGSDIDVLFQREGAPGQVVSYNKFVYWVDEASGDLARLPTDHEY